MRTNRVRRNIAILVVLGCAAYLILNIVDLIRFWLAYHSCDSNCGFAYGGSLWIFAAFWVVSLVAAAAIGTRLAFWLRRSWSA